MHQTQNKSTYSPILMNQASWVSTVGATDSYVQEDPTASILTFGRNKERVESISNTNASTFRAVDSLDRQNANKSMEILQEDRKFAEYNTSMQPLHLQHLPPNSIVPAPKRNDQRQDQQQHIPNSGAPYDGGSGRSMTSGAGDLTSRSRSRGRSQHPLFQKTNTHNIGPGSHAEATRTEQMTPQSSGLTKRLLNVDSNAPLPLNFMMNLNELYAAPPVSVSQALLFDPRTSIVNPSVNHHSAPQLPQQQEQEQQQQQQQQQQDASYASAYGTVRYSKMKKVKGDREEEFGDGPGKR